MPTLTGTFVFLIEIQQKINCKAKKQKSLSQPLTNNRRSVRSYLEGYKISLFELFQILYYSYGINRKQKLQGEDLIMNYRFVPSAGGLYPLEIYVLLFSSHIDSGLYHYNVKNNGLSLIKKENYLKKIGTMVHTEPYVNVKNSCGVIFVTSVIERQMIKYGERSYRFMLQEVGHVSQMISLNCERIGLGSCITGGYLDDEINKLIGIDGVFENVQNIIFIGKKDETYRS